MPKATVLLVDDEPKIVETVQYVLEEEGYEVVTARDGPSALEAVHRHVPDIVLLDVMMPGEDGYSVSRKIHEAAEQGRLPRKIPVVLITARDLSHDPVSEKVTRRVSQAELIVYKPFDIDDLLFLIDRVLKNARGK
jgi:DNA-binding response OmpR family regulator